MIAYAPSYLNLINRAEELASEKQFEEAEALYREAAENQGLDLDELHERGVTFMHSGEFEDASYPLLQAYDANPVDLSLILSLLRLGLLSQNEEQALMFSERLIERNAGHAEGRALCGLAYELQGDLERAYEELELAMQMDPTSFVASYNYGRLMFEDKVYPAAIEALKKAVLMNPDDADARYLLAASNREIGQFDDAILEMTIAIELAPEESEMHLFYAELLVDADKLDDVVYHIEKALEYTDPDVAMLERASFICLHGNLFDAAANYTIDLLEKVPDYQRGWLNLSLFHMASDRMEESEKAVEIAIELDPDDWEAHFFLGNLYRNTSRYDQSEASYLRAFALAAPDDAYKPVGNLGVALMERAVLRQGEGGEQSADDTRKAIEYLEQAVSLSPSGEFRFHYNLALAYASVEEDFRSLPLLKEILSQAPKDSEEFDAAREMLDAIAGRELHEESPA